MWKASSLLVLLCGSPCCKWPYVGEDPSWLGKPITLPHMWRGSTECRLQSSSRLRSSLLKFSLHYVASVLRTALNWKPLPHTQYIGSRCTVNWKISFKTRLHIAWKLAVIWVHITALGSSTHNIPHIKLFCSECASSAFIQHQKLNVRSPSRLSCYNWNPMSNLSEMSQTGWLKLQKFIYPRSWGWKPRSRCWQFCFLLRPLSLDCRWPPYVCRWASLCTCTPCVPSSFKKTGCFRASPLWPCLNLYLFIRFISKYRAEQSFNIWFLCSVHMDNSVPNRHQELSPLPWTDLFWTWKSQVFCTPPLKLCTKS